MTAAAVAAAAAATDTCPPPSPPPPRLQGVILDVTDPSSIQAAFDETIATFGQLDILCASRRPAPRPAAPPPSAPLGQHQKRRLTWRWLTADGARRGACDPAG